MIPEGFSAFGGGGATNIHPAVVCALILVAILLLCLPRRDVIIALLGAFFLIPTDHVVLLGPLHFSTLRIVILLGWLRVFAMNDCSEHKLLAGGVNGIDKSMAFMWLLSAINFVLLWREFGAVINQFGELYTALGCYFLLRHLIRNGEDVDRVFRTLAYITIVIATIMVIERVTHVNPYAFLGGDNLALLVTTLQRGDRFRCWGPFGHAILAGVFGSTMLPILFAFFRRTTHHRRLAVFGLIAATVIVLTSNSSTPLLAYMAAVGALFLWPLRRHMRIIRWGMVLSLIPLQLMMNNPVWHVIGRLDFLGGNAWDRERLVDNFLRHFGDWWLLGVKSTEDWGWSMWDLSNQFVSVGAEHGLFPLICFLFILVYAFRYVGVSRRASEGKSSEEFFFWALGAALFSHIAAFFGVAYFDQTRVAWYALLAVIPVVTAPMRRTVIPTSDSLCPDWRMHCGQSMAPEEQTTVSPSKT